MSEQNIYDETKTRKFYEACKVGDFFTIKDLMNDETIDVDEFLYENKEDLENPINYLFTNLKNINLLAKEKKESNIIKKCIKISIENNFYDIIYFLKDLELSICENNNYPNLWKACICSKVGEIKKLIENNDFINDLCDVRVNDDTLLITLIKQNYCKIVKIILEYFEGSKLSRLLNQKDNEGKPLIMFVIENTYSEFIKYLTNFNELDLNVEDNKGKNILHYIKMRNDNNISILLLHKLNPNYKYLFNKYSMESN